MNIVENYLTQNEPLKIGDRVRMLRMHEIDKCRNEHRLVASKKAEHYSIYPGAHDVSFSEINRCVGLEFEIVSILERVEGRYSSKPVYLAACRTVTSNVLLHHKVGEIIDIPLAILKRL